VPTHSNQVLEDEDYVDPESYDRHNEKQQSIQCRTGEFIIYLQGTFYQKVCT